MTARRRSRADRAILRVVRSANGPAKAWAVGLLLGVAAAPAAAISLAAVHRCGSDTACLGQLEAAALRESAGAARRDGVQLALQFGAQPSTRFVDQHCGS
jgi:hypothetical protein